jgi:predicted dienelactone hydrolase
LGKRAPHSFTPPSKCGRCVQQDGQTTETDFPFPPFKGVILGEEEKQTKATPLMIHKEESQQTNSEKRLQSVFEQLNWTNTALRGMVAHTFVTNEYSRKKKIDQLQVFTNQVTSSINFVNSQVYEIKNTLESEKDSSKRDHEE